jgi:hypothetical protein
MLPVHAAYFIVFCGYIISRAPLHVATGTNIQSVCFLELSSAPSSGNAICNVLSGGAPVCKESSRSARSSGCRLFKGTKRRTNFIPSFFISVQDLLFAIKQSTTKQAYS